MNSSQNSSQKFNFRLTERFLENYATPPEDPLGELTHFEMAIRRFCFEYDHKVFIEIGDEKIQVFLDPDICMILDDNLPEQISKLSQGKPIEIDFAESCTLTIKLVPNNDRISCILNKFGTSGWEKVFEFDRTHVLDVLRGFLQQVMQLAVDKGFITAEEKEEFISPAFINPQLKPLLTSNSDVAKCPLSEFEVKLYKQSRPAPTKS
jgi:hypothetical protein